MSWEPIPETLTLSEVHWQGSWEMMRAPETVEGAFLINRNWSEARQEIQWGGGESERRDPVTDPCLSLFSQSHYPHKVKCEPISFAPDFLCLCLAREVACAPNHFQTTSWTKLHLFPPPKSGPLSSAPAFMPWRGLHS